MNRMKTGTALFVALLVLIAAGCAAKVKTDLSTEFSVVPVRDVAVAGVVWPEGRWKAEERETARDIGRLFREMTAERLGALNYGVVPLETVDERASAAGTATGLKGLSPAEAAKRLGADSVMYIRVESWNVDRVLAYTSLEIKATFELYSGTGTRLWQARYSTSEADLGLDDETIRLAVIETYEPRIQRFVDAVMATLPRSSHEAPPRRFFDWLP